ncbi:MAG: DUF4177 domain-containing protein [bacterium]|nr:DUF4177 domain-containing protein [bacterium]
MFEYKFVNLERSFFSVKGALKDDYHQIIHQHAAEGWRLVQIFAPAPHGYGKLNRFEMIFEKEKKEGSFGGKFNDKFERKAKEMA